MQYEDEGNNKALNDNDKEPEDDAIAHASDAWREAFTAQLTATTLGRVHRHMEILIVGLDGLICESVAEDLVQEAVLATQEGKAVWRPDRVSLRQHLADHAEAALARKRARVGRTISIDAITARDDDEGEEDADASTFERDHLAVEPDVDRALEVRRVSHEVELALWRRFAEDQGAMAVLNCFAVGVTDAPTIATLVGATPADVAAIRKRIARGLDDLSHPLTERVRRALA